MPLQDQWTQSESYIVWPLIKSRQQHECSACGAPCDTPLRPHCRHVLEDALSSSQPKPRRLLRSLAEVAHRSVRPALDASYTLPPGAAGAPPVDVPDLLAQLDRAGVLLLNLDSTLHNSEADFRNRVAGVHASRPSAAGRRAAARGRPRAAPAARAPSVVNQRVLS